MATVSLTSPSIVKAAIPNQFTSSITKAPLGSVKTISKSFGLKCSVNRRTTMAMYKIKLVGPKGEVDEFEATGDEFILEAAEAAGVELPYCCRAGACSICTAKVVSGSVHQPDAIYLEDEQIKEGYMLTCVSNRFTLTRNLNSILHQNEVDLFTSCFGLELLVQNSVFSINEGIRGSPWIISLPSVV